jgi:very-short-patch-repair endonuclease
MGDPQVFLVRRDEKDYRESLSRRYRRPHRGVRVAREVGADLGVRCDAALVLAPAGAAISGRTAAELWNLPVPARFRGSTDQRPQLMAPVLAGGSTVDVAGIECRLCLLPPWQVTMLAGRAVTTPARTFLDLAAVLELADLVAVGDVILRRRLATPGELMRVLDWASRRRGVRRARKALPLLSTRSRSPQESRLRAMLAMEELPAPEPNAQVHDERGGFLAEGDLVWRKYRVMIEYDGQVHLGETQRRKDAARRNDLLMAGWLLLVYTADVLATRPARIVSDVSDALRSRGWRGTWT